MRLLEANVSHKSLYTHSFLSVDVKSLKMPIGNVVRLLSSSPLYIFTGVGFKDHLKSIASSRAERASPSKPNLKRNQDFYAAGANFDLRSP